jgi:hypothetical protein
MTFSMAKKHTTQLTFIAQAEIQVQEAFLKKKKEKGTLTTFLMAKKHTTQLTFIAQAEIQAQEASPKEKKVKGTLMTFPMAKRKTNLNLLSKPKLKSKVQEGVL